MFLLGTCESEISVRIESRIESGVVIYMFNADCHVGVVYLIMCKPTTLLHATSYGLFFVCSVGLRVYIAVQLHVKWSCKHKSQLQMVQRLIFC